MQNTLIWTAKNVKNRKKKRGDTTHQACATARKEISRRIHCVRKKVFILFRIQHWRPIIDRPTTLRSSHAQPSSTAIRLVYANLVSSLSTSSLLLQPRLVYVNLVSFKPCRSATFLVREPNLRIGRFSIDRCTQRGTNRPSAHRFTMVS